MSYPSCFKALAARLSNYSSTIRRVSPMNKDSGYVAGDSIIFSLPTQALVDLRTLKLHVKGSTSSVVNPTKGYVALPPNLTVFDRITLSFNGNVIQTTPNNYYQLHKILDDFTTSSEARQVRRVINNDQLPLFSADTGDVYLPLPTYRDVGMSAGTQLWDGYRDNKRNFVMDKWPGTFLSTSEPSVLSTSITGTCQVEFHLAKNDILTVLSVGGYPAAAPTMGRDELPQTEQHALDANYDYAGLAAGSGLLPGGASYTLDNAYLTVKTIDISDGAFGSFLKDQVEGGMDIVYEHWTRFVGNQTSGNAVQNLRASINGNSVNLALGTFEPTDASSQQLWPGQSTLIATPKDWTNGYNPGTYANTQVPRALQRGFITDASQDFTTSMQVNNVPVNRTSTIPDIWSETVDEFNLKANGMNPRISNLEFFKKGFLVCPTRLNAKTSQTDIGSVRYLSGLDSREAKVELTWSTTGATDGNINVVPVLWVQTTAIDRVGPGQTHDPIP